MMNKLQIIFAVILFFTAGSFAQGSESDSMWINYGARKNAHSSFRDSCRGSKTF